MNRKYSEEFKSVVSCVTLFLIVAIGAFSMVLPSSFTGSNTLDNYHQSDIVEENDILFVK